MRNPVCVLVGLVVIGVLPPTLHAQDTTATATMEPEAASAVFEIQADGTVGQSGLTPEELDALTAEISSGLRCLVCRGQSILESQVTLAQDMRALTKELLAEGNTPDEVRGYFVARYGEYVLLKPKASGWNWIVYALPFAAILIGAFILHARMRRWAGADEAADDDPLDVEATSETPATDSEFSEENERWLAEAIRGG